MYRSLKVVYLVAVLGLFGLVVFLGFEDDETTIVLDVLVGAPDPNAFLQSTFPYKIPNQIATHRRISQIIYCVRQII